MLSTLCVYLQAGGLKGLGHPVSAGILQRLHRMIDRSPRIRTRTATAQPQHLPPNLNHGLWGVVPPYPTSRPYMLFLFVGSQFCTPASFPRSVALPQLPSASTLCIFVGRHAGSRTGDFNPISSRHARRTQAFGSGAYGADQTRRRYIA